MINRREIIDTASAQSLHTDWCDQRATQDRARSHDAATAPGEGGEHRPLLAP